MCMLDTAVLSMQGESKFVEAYNSGVAKTEFWRSMLEDCLTLQARIPTIAAAIYRLRFGKGPRIDPKPDLDYAQNFAHMLGLDQLGDEAADMIRLYLVLHCDHEGGNVSAHTCSLVGSALSDIFYAVSAGLNGLSGPLHGLANQECLKWVLHVRDQFGGVPSDEQLRKYAWETLDSGRVIPGYGHAVLRVTDPRFDALRRFGMEHFSDDEIVQIVDRVFHVVPDVLKEHGKAKNPWPNVDAASGSLLYHYGMTEFPYYTVMFSVSRVMGMCAQSVWNRAMLVPIERPKSVTIKWLQEFVAKNACPPDPASARSRPPFRGGRLFAIISKTEARFSTLPRGARHARLLRHPVAADHGVDGLGQRHDHRDDVGQGDATLIRSSSGDPAVRRRPQRRGFGHDPALPRQRGHHQPRLHRGQPLPRRPHRRPRRGLRPHRRHGRRLGPRLELHHAHLQQLRQRRRRQPLHHRPTARSSTSATA